MGFFDEYVEFYKTSKTGFSPNRLNSRYNALIEFNKTLIQNSSILDLGSHDGRWSFAALKNGAAKVIGIEGREHLVKNSIKNMTFYGISEEKYSFIMGDVFEEIKKIPPKTIDVVFCFGFFYHIMNHITLLEEIKKLKAKYLILDTFVSESDKPIIELIEEDSDLEANGVTFENPSTHHVLVGHPSKIALELMLKNLGYEYHYYEWANAGIDNWEKIQDYHRSKRISLFAKLT